MLTFFRKSAAPSQPLLVDIHSHLLPQLDDGVQSLEEAEALVRQFIDLGYRKLITTPHVISDTYRNTPEIISASLNELQMRLRSKNINIELQAAAEYYLDENCYDLVRAEKPMLTFGKNYLLFETSFITEPLNLKEFIFHATTKGYKPVLAHPERYMYIQQNLEKAEDLINRGVLFQVNISSLTGYYSRPAQQTAERLIDRGWTHLLGSDCHHLQHLQLLEQARKSKYFRKALTLPLLNNSLQ